ncbi:hypothetical protein MGH68_08910 [Erysipelothrix sp. D19-032]
MLLLLREYNRAVLGALKNALDYLHPKYTINQSDMLLMADSAVYRNSDTSLSRGEQEMASVRTMVTFSLMADFENMSVFKPHDYHAVNLEKMFDQVLLWAKAFKTIR